MVIAILICVFQKSWNPDFLGYNIIFLNTLIGTMEYYIVNNDNTVNYCSHMCETEIIKIVRKY